MKIKSFFDKFSPRSSSLENPTHVRIGIVAAALLITFFLYHFQFLKRFEYVTYDYRCLMKGPRATVPELAVIEISDDSVAKIGRWPWDRDWHALLIKILTEFGAKAIVFDVIFSEASDPPKDALLSKAIQQSGRVYLAEVAERQPKTGETHLLSSMPIFSDYAQGSGHINLYPDLDGVMRRIPIWQQADDQRVPQLSLAVASSLFGVDPAEIKVEKGALWIPRFENSSLRIPLDPQGNFIIRWAGRWRETFAHYSYADILTSYTAEKKGEAPALDLKQFKGKVFFIGTTASGLFDIRSTPLEPSYPAVGVNLTILNNILEKKFISQAPPWIEFLILILLSVGLFFSTSSSSYVKNVLYTLGLAVAHVVLAFLVFDIWGWWVSIIYPLIEIFLVYFVATLYNQLVIAMERANLLKLATRDSLTGLYNVGHFKLLMRAELTTLAIRRDRVMSILMGDIDDFKHTNDTYGHLTGDAVLREVSAIVRSTCRALDVAARYGGEELIIMLPGASAEEAYKVGEKIRQAVHQKVFFQEKGDFRTSISLGVTQINPDEKDIEAIIGRADKALYEAKRTGKNKVVIAEEGH